MIAASSNLSGSVSLVQLISLLLGGIFLAYITTILIAFLRKRHWEPGDPDAFHWHLFVPCRDEEAVIGGTIDYLTATFPAAEIWVICLLYTSDAADE